jgi:O-antigen chain-terminating methyltransferase
MENTDQEKYAEDKNLHGIAQSKDSIQCSLSRFCKTLPELPPDATYSISDFLAFHDHDFIINAYQGILGRSPDNDGYHHYLNQLRQGRLTKIEILGRLRFSSEGRSWGAKVKGLFLPFVIHSSYRIPALGHIIALSGYFLRLPVIIRNFIRFEAYVNSELRELRTRLDANMENIEGHFQALNASKAEHRDIKTLNEQKADREKVTEELKHLAQAERRELDELERRKIDAEHVESLVAGKADRQELESLERRKADAEQIETLEAMKAHTEKVVSLDQRLSHIEHEYKTNSSDLAEISRQVQEHKHYILDQQRRLALLLEEARKRLPDPISQKQIEKMVQEEDHLLDAMYVSFEDQFRGTREDIKNRLSVYLPVITEAGAGTDDFPVLDIGCGRGEWLELLKYERLTAKGLDLNRVMVQQCQEIGLEVAEQEALAGLRELPPNSLGAITGMHIIEHLPFRQMIALYDEALRVIKPGGVIIFETPNPENLMVGAYTFYSDPTHKNPLPPHLVQFLIEARGFVRPQIMRLHPNETLKEALSNMPEIKEFFAGPQDYAVIAYKAG